MNFLAVFHFSFFKGISHALIVAVVVSGILNSDGPVAVDTRASNSTGSSRGIYRLWSKSLNRPAVNRRDSNTFDDKVNQSATSMPQFPILEKGKTKNQVDSSTEFTSQSDFIIRVEAQGPHIV